MQVSIDAFEWYAVSGWLVKAAQLQFHGSISWFNSRSLLRGTLCGSLLSPSVATNFSGIFSSFKIWIHSNLQ
jgi:hypothetical protein